MKQFTILNPKSLINKFNTSDGYEYVNEEFLNDEIQDIINSDFMISGLGRLNIEYLFIKKSDGIIFLENREDARAFTMHDFSNPSSVDEIKDDLKFALKQFEKEYELLIYQF